MQVSLPVITLVVSKAICNQLILLRYDLPHGLLSGLSLRALQLT